MAIFCPRAPKPIIFTPHCPSLVNKSTNPFLPLVSNFIQWLIASVYHSPRRYSTLRFAMSDAAETKPDPTTSAPGEQKPETTTTGEGEKSASETVADGAKEAAEATKDAAAKTSDSVFSMFGGGPKKEKKEEPEEAADEPSGSSKAQKGEEVCCNLCQKGDIADCPGAGITMAPTRGVIVFIRLYPVSLNSYDVL